MVLAGTAVILGVWSVTAARDRPGAILGAAETDPAEPARVIVSSDGTTPFDAPLRARVGSGVGSDQRPARATDRVGGRTATGGERPATSTPSPRQPTPTTSTPTPTTPTPTTPTPPGPATGGGATDGTPPVVIPGGGTPPPTPSPTTGGGGSVGGGIQVVVSPDAGTTIGVGSGIVVTLPPVDSSTDPAAISVQVPGLPTVDLALPLPE